MKRPFPQMYFIQNRSNINNNDPKPVRQKTISVLGSFTKLATIPFEPKSKRDAR